MSAEGENQIELWEEFERLPAIDRSQPTGDYDGSRLKVQKPEIYNLIVRALADPSMSQRAICAWLHVSARTVQGVRAREPHLIKNHATAMSRKLENASHVLAERVIEEAPTMSGKDAAIALGIVTDKHLLITGQPTVRIDDARSGADVVKSVQDFLAALREKNASAIEVEAEVTGEGQTSNTERRTSNVELIEQEAVA